MDIRDIAESVKCSVTIRQVVEHYGFQLNHSGFLNCPFHAGDRTASLKVYEDDQSWHCFGCGAGGSVIDFVEELFQIGALEACQRINDDFALGLPIGRKPTLREYQKMRQRFREAQKRRNEEKVLRAAYEAKYNELWDLWSLYDRWRMELAPAEPGDQIDERYAEAVKNIDYIAYRIDTEL